MRFSLHPTTTDEEVNYITDALKQIEKSISLWQNDYSYNSRTNEYHHKNENGSLFKLTEQWFEVG